VKLHDLRPADGSRVPRTRVGRGIAAGKGKTAGRGTKGQKARAGGSIPPWFEGGQTPLHMRIPKLRGFKNRGKVDYEIVNVGDIDARVEAGAFAKAGAAPKKGEQLTINADVLRAVGLVRNIKKPLKILGGGELSTALFVVADAFTKSATAKIEGAGGAVSVLEVPTESRAALGVDEAGAEAAPKTEPKATRAPKASKAAARASKGATAEAATATLAEPEADAEPVAPAKAKPARKAKAPADADGADPAEAVEAVSDESSPVDEPADAPDAVADAPDAVADASDAAPVTGDDTESDSAVPGDDA
jgi:large subunit ribosomal protein L15